MQPINHAKADPSAIPTEKMENGHWLRDEMILNRGGQQMQGLDSKSASP
jgi:hypothetical protein